MPDNPSAQAPQEPSPGRPAQTAEQIATAERTIHFLGRELRVQQYRLACHRRYGSAEGGEPAAVTHASIKQIRARIKREIRRYPAVFGGRFDAAE